MIYPNGNLTINQLKKMIRSPNYEVYAEDILPTDNYGSPNNICRGARTLLNSEDELYIYISKENTIICYDFTEEYYKKHPYPGESKTYTKEVFHWQYQGEHPYGIYECTAKDYTTLELVRHVEDFEDTCWTIAQWSLNEEGYEFHSIGSRLFLDIDVNDFEKVWEAIQAADEYLRKRFITQ